MNSTPGEGMLDRLATLAHRLRDFIETLLPDFKQVLVHPSPDVPLISLRTLRLEWTAAACSCPIIAQRPAVPLRPAGLRGVMQLANNLGPLYGQVTNFIEDAAQGTALYSAPLAAQLNHGPFQGGALASVCLSGVAASSDFGI
jgi:hypothetical protein